MENKLYRPELDEISATLDAAAKVLLNADTADGIDWKTAFELYKSVSEANLRLAGIRGSIGFYENLHGSLGAMALLADKAPATETPGLGTITFPEGVTLESFADNILPRHEEKRGHL